MSAGLRAGYKQTEVGVIPEDWEASNIGSNSAWMSGGTPSRSNIEYWSGTVPWISGSTLKSVEISTSDQFLTAQAVAAGSKMAPVDSTLLLVRGSALHNEIRAGLVVAPVAFNQDVKALVPSATVEAKFLTYYILAYSNQLLKLVSSAGNSAGVLDTELVQNFKFLKPPLPEQRAIAEVLSDADALIESLAQLITKKRDLKQAAMQQLLTGQTRLPGFSGEWEEWSLFELAGGRKELFDDGDWIESEHITDDGIRLIQTGNIGVGKFIEKDERKYIFEASFFSLRCKELKQGDLLICRLAEPAGRSCVLPDIGESKVVTSVDVTIFRPPAAVANRVFLSNVLSTAEWFQAVSDRSGGTTHKRISRGALGRMRIMIPDVNEQTAIATILSDMDAELAELESRLAKARHIKQGMMQELLTGRIRLV